MGLALAGSSTREHEHDAHHADSMQHSDDAQPMDMRYHRFRVDSKLKAKFDGIVRRYQKSPRSGAKHH